MASFGRVGAREQSEPTEAQSFERLRPRLEALAHAAPPFVDPRALAMRALLVTDRLAQPDLRSKVEALGRAGACNPRSVDDLRVAARALLHVLGHLEGAASVPRTAPPVVVRTEALRLRRAGVEALQALDDDDDVRLWIEVFALPFEDVDVVCDLRTLARLQEEHSGRLTGSPRAAAEAARRYADLLEADVRTTSPDAEWTPWRDRAFSLTVALYEEACRIGRFIAAAGGTAATFPSLPSVARARRRGQPVSSHERVRVDRTTPVDVAVLDVAELVPPGPPPLPASASASASASAPAPAPAPAPASAPAPAPAPAPASAPASAPSSPPTRQKERHNVEIEVDMLSDSNFYVGFTENLSGGGLFVATYFVRPLGSKVEMRVRVPGRSEPMVLEGEVRWIREPTATSDAWPGMGIRFETISEEDQAAIEGFLGRRDPMFFVE